MNRDYCLLRTFISEQKMESVRLENASVVFLKKSQSGFVHLNAYVWKNSPSAPEFSRMFVATEWTPDQKWTCLQWRPTGIFTLRQSWSVSPRCYLDLQDLRQDSASGADRRWAAGQCDHELTLLTSLTWELVHFMPHRDWEHRLTAPSSSVIADERGSGGVLMHA